MSKSQVLKTKAIVFQDLKFNIGWCYTGFGGIKTQNETLRK